MLKTNPVGFKICSISESERAKFQAILDSPVQAVSFPDRLAALKHWSTGYGGSSSSTDADCSIIFPNECLSTTTSPIRSTDDPSSLSQSFLGQSITTTASPMRNQYELRHIQITKSTEIAVDTTIASETSP